MQYIQDHEQSADRESIVRFYSLQTLAPSLGTFCDSRPSFKTPREPLLGKFAVCLNCSIDPEEQKKIIAFNFFLCNPSSRSSL